MKVYLYYSNSEESVSDESTLSTKLRFNIPNDWHESPCKILLDECLPKLLPVNQEENWIAEDFEIRCGKVILQCSDVIGKHIHEYNDLYVFRKKKQQDIAIPDGHVRCTNFGCGNFFDPNHNADDACHYHSKGPVFHDLAKHWACCPSKKGYDWEEFERIPPCQVGKHCAEVKKCSSAEEVCGFPQPVLNVLEKCALNPIPTIPMEYNKTEIMNAIPSEIVDGKAKCRNFGCCQEFVVAENHNTACTFHKAGPEIRDTKKYWKCCSEKKCYEFDDFMKITGCCIGPHKL